METADRIGERRRVVGDRLRHPGMRELQQEPGGWTEFQAYMNAALASPVLTVTSLSS
jgi:hypothetical protein